MNSLLGSLALAPLEQAFNFLIKEDPHLADLLSPFENKTVEVRTRQPSLTVCVILERGRIRLSGLDAATMGIEADACIEAPAGTLFSMLTSKTKALVNTELQISGDIELVQDMLRALHKADIQWQDLVGSVFGDVVSRHMQQLAEAGGEWRAQANSRIKRNLDDYLKAEARILPHSLDAARFAEQVHDLRLQLDRLGARTQGLNARLDKLISD